MSRLLETISQISIYLKDSANLDERISEVAIFQPLSRKAHFDEETKALKARKWDFYEDLSSLSRLTLNIQVFLFQKFKHFIPPERKTPEAKFKTVIAILLAQEGLKEFFLSTPERQRSFFQAIARAASLIGYEGFLPPEIDASDRICRELTLLSGKEESLIDDLRELNLQIATLPKAERNEILYTILDQVERPPVQSVLEVIDGDHVAVNIEFQTTYAKYNVRGIDPKTGQIQYTCFENQATSSIRTKKNTKPGEKGAMNQRCVSILSEKREPQPIGTYSGELTTENHVLEQLLFMLNKKGNTCVLLDESHEGEEKAILFTSLFSWNEFDKILSQHRAVNALDGIVLSLNGGEQQFKLSLYHRNIPFNALNHFPSPAETQATLNDLNDETLVQLLSLSLDHPPFSFLEEMMQKIKQARKESDFIRMQKELLAQIDRFRKQKSEIITYLEKEDQTLREKILKILLTRKRPDGKELNRMDELIYTDLLTKELGILHNKNCENSIDRSAGANAADKAQVAFQKIEGDPFLPGMTGEEGASLFRVLYSLYLVWEEPEINAGLSTGFMGEKFFNNFIQKNPETTRYLIKWLKKHPEMYLGLSDYRR